MPDSTGGFQIKNQLDSYPASSRELIWSALVLCLVVSPHILNIHYTVLLCFTFIVAWKIMSQWYRRMVSRWIIIIFALISFFVTAWHYGPPIGRDPGVAFLVTLIGLKSLEGRARRDVRIILLLGIFIVITHFLYRNSLSVVTFLFAMVFVLSWSMIQLGHVSSENQIKSDFRLTAKMVIQAIPFAILLFFLFPRFSGALWLLQTQSDLGVTGMSDTLTMGSIADMVESDEIAFTATFPGKSVPRNAARYWRGGVLWDTDGRKWVKGRSYQPYQINVVPVGGIYEYDIEMASTRNNWLFSLDLPIIQPAGSVLTADLYLSRNKSIDPPASYSIISSSRYINKTINAEQRQKGINLAPDTITPRLRRLVDSLIKASTTDQKIDPTRYAFKIFSHFNQNPFVYSLRPPLLLSNSPVDEFMFSTRKGFCEHYASSFVTLMRAANVPARLVIGYLGGEHNPVSDQIVVRQADAHAWAEYWSEDRGWIRADPTAAIAPERIENPINYNLSLARDGAVIFDLEDLAFLGSLLRDGRWYSAYVQQQWQKWFVGFDYKRQQSLIENIGLEKFSPQTLASLAFVAGLLILIGCASIFYRNDRYKKDQISRLYARYCAKLEKQGVIRKQTEGPMDFYARCEASFPQAKDQLHLITDLYTSLRYGADQAPGQVIELKNQIRSLRLT